ncbi:hypothetical protein EHI8A_037640 [Entamoeba histolytica HM-1:IMSS-B]|uniref:Uncharacterized protein n=6 Tax=Entamoeba histolytica TaxID=5759 RepID=C4LWK8_ENTH1|nr:hypothetical protein EHI_069200 [Entamoeba histolytica HM-1:IMSS]EMD43206.1 Hypothetical protein EHI5A_046140 [Entamoeba histolytica KU27]EMH74179.1 hypothetical protein EHI8A_037640 [Entamoeba histolytica HM-1:IMSS-B]EMS14105.1 hypothetical protein KM1_062370 [Entamoeba histolytica HM-3:IMSS]ENY62732.1 hypothetical protein EHI7A_028140 [Entamoeba histolytica HM-1:IMSS-A]GAT93098.1 hypothetical protein CL6EHI_069200 [Entamoeba histolytica]|eukprot:XP_655311.1 hypothetical protein EHI_069200 [Entamoeba histolytica HM-1:IMSS]
MKCLLVISLLIFPFVQSKYFITFYDSYIQVLNEGHCYYIESLKQSFKPYFRGETMISELYNDLNCTIFIGNSRLEDIGYYMMSVSFIYADFLPDDLTANLKFGCNKTYGINQYQLTGCVHLEDTSYYINQSVENDIFITSYYSEPTCTTLVNKREVSCSSCFYDTIYKVERTVDCSRIYKKK